MYEQWLIKEQISIDRNYPQEPNDNPGVEKYNNWN